MILYAYPVSYSDFSIPQALPDPVGTVPAYTPQKTDPVHLGIYFLLVQPITESFIIFKKNAHNAAIPADIIRIQIFCFCKCLG